ncbi:MAG: RsmE family RNA methyltransferase [Candidatus Peregrinibacteria bacterium]|nr:RsmE family RNA methyltransferase [Candidatus Peregrinibacteria bacterium]
MHRFLLREGDVVDDKVFVIISEELRNQWTKVLRFRIGEKVILFRDDDKEYVGEITSILPKIIQGNVLNVSERKTELPVNIIVAQSILKNPEKLEWILQKGTELGMSDFYPLITHRTERQFLPKFERLQRILVEATEQCGRCKVPVLHEPMKFEAFLKTKVTKDSLVLIPHTMGGKKMNELKLIDEKSIVVCIGPEGGFDEKEVEDVTKVGGISVTLGKRVLRSETAAIAAVAMLAAHIEV